MISAGKKPAKKNIKKNNLGLYLLLGMTLLSAFLFFSILKTKNSNRGAAGIKMYFEPKDLVLTSSGKDRMKVKTVKIKAKAKNRVVFARVTIVFNPSKINIVSQIKTNVNLSNVVEKTPLSEANEGGRAVIVVAAAPDNNPPAGDFELASFTVKASGNSGRETATEINFLTSDMQIVDKNVRELAIEAEELEIKFESIDL